MSCANGGSGAWCTRWVLFAGMLASAVAAFVLVSRLREAGPSVPDRSDEIYGM